MTFTRIELQLILTAVKARAELFAGMTADAEARGEKTDGLRESAAVYRRIAERIEREAHEAR